MQTRVICKGNIDKLKGLLLPGEFIEEQIDDHASVIIETSDRESAMSQLFHPPTRFPSDIEILHFERPV